LILHSATLAIEPSATVVIYDILQTYRQQIQAERLLRKTKDYFKGTPLRECPFTDELIALHDVAFRHEMSMHYHRTARKRISPALPSQRILM